MKEPKITNIVKFYTLLLLYEKPRHGYEIIKNLSTKLEKNISAGEIYPFLKKLQKGNYIISKKTGLKGKKTYYLTKNGAVLVKKLFNRFGDLADAFIESRLVICAHCGCEVYKGSYKERIKGKIQEFCCEHCAKSYKSGVR